MKIFNIRNRLGFSLVELMVVLAALGGVALIVTKLGKDSLEIQNESSMTNDYNDLVREAHFLLNNKHNCQVSFSGLKFKPEKKATLIKEVILKSRAEVENVKSVKIISSKVKYKNLNIDSIYLKINPKSEEVGSNNGLHQATAILVIQLAKSAIKIETPMIEHELNLTYKISDDGLQAEIVDCLGNFDQKYSAKIWCGTIKNPCGSEMIEVVAIGRFKDKKFTGTFQPTATPIELNEMKICHAGKEIDADLKLCE